VCHFVQAWQVQRGVALLRRCCAASRRFMDSTAGAALGGAAAVVSATGLLSPSGGADAGSLTTMLKQARGVTATSTAY
jgi:hypothetical protein